MNTKLLQRYESIKSILDIAVNRKDSFIVAEEAISFSAKRFVLKYYYRDEEATKRQIKKVNSIIKDSYNIDSLKSHNNLDYRDEEIDKLEVFGEVNARIIGNELSINVNTHSHQKNFTFNERDTMDSFVHFLENEISKEATELSLG
ncbi:hypothetical protein [Pontibacillus salipaludis]|uniref:Uncharacterized protein n=1 Tax=Pontibacillus salipaludis TaxID=1697394 RepID=A0ABQ1Q5F6_9BACI|nr:hypothetical protein [Pontibacillus salipaludis]GGD12770.1 hypothetical protein GCM10011389_20400 [Pontibacillus salipaludis]